MESRFTPFHVGPCSCTVLCLILDDALMTAGVRYATDEEVAMRRIVGVRPEAGCGQYRPDGVTDLVRSATVAGLKLQEAGLEATREWRELHRLEAERARAAKKWAEKWKAALFRGGPRRAAALREASLAHDTHTLRRRRRRGELSAGDLTAALRKAAAAWAEERKGSAASGAQLDCGLQAVELAADGQEVETRRGCGR